MHHNKKYLEVKFIDFQSKGMGIGLATVKSILEAHGSAINVESELGGGSEFSFRLPVAAD